MSTSDVRRVSPPCVGVTILRGGAGEDSQSEAFILSIDQSEAFILAIDQSEAIFVIKNAFRIHLEIGTEEAGTILSVRVR